MKSLKNILFLAFLIQVPVWSFAQAPELSADEPIAYKEDLGLLIATGNAVYRDENTTVEADTIRYHRDENRIEAEGNVQVTRTGLRLLTTHLIYEADTKTITAGHFRAGYPPMFMEGESFSGNLDQIDFSKISLYFQEPVGNSPRLQVESGTWTSDDSIRGSGLRLNAFGALKVPLPAFEYALGSPAASVDGSLGYRSRLGVYAQSKWLYPFSRQLAAGGNLDLYTARGVLVGPAFEWKSDKANLVLTVDTGWIHDHSFDDRGFDILGNRIEQDRGFAGFGLRADDGGSLQFQARTLYLSDSEVLRDFRQDEYFKEYQPDSFVDFTWQKSAFLLNVFARRQVNDYYGMIERLPEIRAEWLPSELADTGFYLQASAAALRYRLKAVTPMDFDVLFPDNPLGLPAPLTFSGRPPWEMFESPYYNRLDGSVTLTRPISLPASLNLVLRGGGRWTDYSRDSYGSQPSLSGDRLVGELGFDLSRTVARTYKVDRPDWNMERLRHTSRLGVQYRWHPGAEEEDAFIPPLERFHYHARRPVLDLADLTHTDGLREWSVARFGWENRIMVAGKDATYRDLLSFNLFQDVNFSAKGNEDEWDALYAETDFTPFPWLSLTWRQKFLTEQTYSEATYVGLTLRSADLWSVSMEAEYLKSAIEQYRLTGWYRLTENLGLTGYWQYDARLQTWTRQQYGFTRRFGNVWQMEMYVAFNEENDREDDFHVGLRITWLAY